MKTIKRTPRLTFWSVAALLMLLSTTLQAKASLLKVDEAFQLSQPVIEGNTLKLHWKIAPHYHLYQERMSVTSKEAKLGSATFGRGKRVDDPIFGRTTIFENQAEMQVPIVSAPETFSITVSYQGCNKPQGVCYPPQNKTFELQMPKLAAKASSPDTTLPNANSLFQLNQYIVEDSGSELLPVEEAFAFEALPNKNHLILSWQVAPGYHLYQDKIKVKPLKGEIKLSKLQLPPAEESNDPVFGKTQVYKTPFQAVLPIDVLNSNSEIEITYQGCADKSGVCYPPVHKVIKLNPADFNLQTSKAPSPSSSAQAEQSVADTPLSETDQITDTLMHGSVWLVLGTFFIFGLLLAFTPCVFPMIPILSSIIVGQGENITTRRAFTLSLVYVLAMSVTYTLAGVLAGMFGENLQAAFQNPWVLGTFSLIFVLLAFSMFGFYELQLPSRFQSKINNVANQQKGGTLTGVAIMGFLSALIVGPCVAPPLAGALIYIGQTGDALLGGSALFTMSLGMGLPLLLLGTSAGKFLPRAGGWMDAVKAVFGVVMLGVAIWMAERILPEWITLLAWSLLFIVSAVYMGAFAQPSTGWQKLYKGLGIALFIWGIMALVSLALGKPSLLQPLSGLSAGTYSTGQPAQKELHFKKIKSIDELNQVLAEGKPVMLDFYADWCVSCKELEHKTFSDPSVQQALTGITLLQADVTANDAVDKALMKKFGIIGPPAILFFTPDGQELKHLRVVGFKPPEVFIKTINQAFYSN